MSTGELRIFKRTDEHGKLLDHTARERPADIAESLINLEPEQQIESLRLLDPEQSGEVLAELSPQEAAPILAALDPQTIAAIVAEMDPDDAADLLTPLSPAMRDAVLEALPDRQDRTKLTELLAYHPETAGGLMSTDFITVRPDMSMDQAIQAARRQAHADAETMYYLYVTDQKGVLTGVLSLRDLILAPPDAFVRDHVTPEVIAVDLETDQEEVARIISKYDLLAVPVVDRFHRLRGIVTVDDVVDVVEEEATEDIQKVGGAAALDEPYLQTGLSQLVKKRAGWLAALFIGEMLTATAMGYFQKEIERAVVLALFVPLIISSGGNAGSQATTLIIRAMALGEVQLKDWWLVAGREIAAGLSLGLILGAIGLVRVLLWQEVFGSYGANALMIGLTVSVSLVGVVLFGAVAGSLLPFLLRRLGLDPASASAPFVATLVDVTGLVIYFTAASLLLSRTLLAP